MGNTLLTRIRGGRSFLDEQKFTIGFTDNPALESTKYMMFDSQHVIYSKVIFHVPLSLIFVIIMKYIKN